MIFGKNKIGYKGKKSLVIYFSRADENYAVGVIDKGNTEYLAEYIKENTGADLFKVEGKIPYSKDYSTCCDEAKVKHDNNERPELKEMLGSISDYDVIYIGSPVYWGTMPQEMFTQLEKLDFSNKIVRIFVTHEGSGLANIPHDVKELCKGAKVLDDAIAIKGSNAKAAKNKIEEWI